MGKWQKQLNITNESQEVSPFLAGDHKPAMNSMLAKLIQIALVTWPKWLPRLYMVKQNMLNNKPKLTLTYFNIIKEIRWALKTL